MRQYNERRHTDVEDFDRRAERRLGTTADHDEGAERGPIGYLDGHRYTGGNAVVFGQAIRERFSNDTAGGVPSTPGYDRRTDINKTEYDDEEASDDSGASFVTFSNDFAAIRNYMKEGDSGEAVDDPTDSVPGRSIKKRDTL